LAWKPSPTTASRPRWSRSCVMSRGWPSMSERTEYLRPLEDRVRATRR
jgi:hypothetical protein